MLVECGNCGAPLDCGPNDRFVKCAYCDKSNKVASTRTLAAVTPPSWQQPAQWTEADRAATLRAIQQAAGTSAAVGAATRGVSGCLGGVISLVGLGVAIAAVVAVFMAQRGGAPSSVLGGLGLATWDGSAPLSCGGNDELHVSGVTANLPGQTAITADANCAVTIEDSTITAAVGIAATGNRAIRLRNVTLQTTAAGLLLEGNKNASFENVTIVSDGVGVEAHGNASVRLTAGRVEGAPATRTDGNASVQNLGGELVDR